MCFGIRVVLAHGVREELAGQGVGIWLRGRLVTHAKKQSYAHSRAGVTFFFN